MSAVETWLRAPVALLGFNWVACLVAVALLALIVAVARWSTHTPPVYTERAPERFSGPSGPRYDAIGDYVWMHKQSTDRAKEEDR